MLGELVFQILFYFTLAPFAGEGAGGVVSAANVLTSRGFSREQERDADEFGLQALHSAYADVSASIGVFEKFRKLEKSFLGEKFSRILSIASTHPYAGDRVRIVQDSADRRGWKSTGGTVTKLTWLHDRVKQGCQDNALKR